MTTTQDRPELQPILSPIACASWCMHQDGHPGMRDAVDQRCESEEARAYLHLPHDPRDYDYVTVYAERVGPQATPHVFLGFGGSSGVELTPSEARMLARHLRRMAAVARMP